MQNTLHLSIFIFYTKTNKKFLDFLLNKVLTNQNMCGIIFKSSKGGNKK